jgi:DNA-binding XRE family transcriptional regulator
VKLDAKKVVEARERLGLAQGDLASLADVSPNTVLRIEQGLDIRPVTARRIARGLGLTVDDLYPKGEARDSLTAGREGEEQRIEIFKIGPFGLQSLADRIAGLRKQRDHLALINRRRSEEVRKLRAEGVAPYGRGLEMYFFDLAILKRYEEEGIHDHLENVINKGKTVSEEEFELCDSLNKTMGKMFDLTAEARKLERENLEKSDAEATRGLEAISEFLHVRDRA